MTFTMPYPPTVNTYWRIFKGRMILSANARRYKQTAALKAKAAGARPLQGPVSVTLHVYRPRKVGDLDNVLKACLDALRGVAYVDDKQITDISAHRYDDKERPRIDVEIEALGRTGGRP
jgi:crossover junction endodeoxyribonuclease RusA